MKKIFLWKGYHHSELSNIISSAWKNDDLVIVCPPYIKEVSFFIDFLPAGELCFIGEWDQTKLLKKTLSQQCSVSRQSNSWCFHYRNNKRDT
jgi:hypothetical protein